MAADHPECGSSRSPCETLPYASTRCNNQTCHYKIDGGSEETPYEYIINHKEEFTSHAHNLTLHGFGSNLPFVTCKNQNAYDTCIFFSGYHFSASGIVFQATLAGNLLPTVFLSGNLMDASLSNSVFKKVHLFANVATLRDCSFNSSVTRIGSGDQLDMSGCTFIDTSVAVGSTWP